jgi:hypothetical protein
LKDQGVSIVLFVQGVALSEASLRFENISLRTIPLGAKSDFPEKAGADFAVIVLASNRKNPGWVDFNRQASRLKIQASEGILEGDGIFYVVIKDDFGRETRFDIEYEKWWVSTSDVKGAPTKFVEYEVRNRWWDPKSNGTVVTGDDGGWSKKMSGSYPVGATDLLNDDD